MRNSKNLVFVCGPGLMPFTRMFFDHGNYEIIRTQPTTPEGWKDLDVVLLTGGEDVWPGLYNETPLPETRWNMLRDKRDRDVVKCAWSYNKLVVGVCRGGQLLNVMNRGRLWQDVNNHTNPHLVTALPNGRTFTASSTHHQQFRAGPEAVVLAVGDPSAGATEKRADGEIWYPSDHGRQEEDLEVLWYPKTRSLCFQPHPEHEGFDELREYFFSLLDKELHRDASRA